MCYTHLHVIPNTSLHLTDSQSHTHSIFSYTESRSSSNMGTTPQLMTILVWRDEADAMLVSIQAASNWIYVAMSARGREGGRERHERDGGREEWMTFTQWSKVSKLLRRVHVHTYTHNLHTNPNCRHVYVCCTTVHMYMCWVWALCIHNAHTYYSVVEHLQQSTRGI